MSFLAVTLVSLIASQAVGQKWGSVGGHGAWGGFQKGTWGTGANRWGQQGNNNWRGNSWGWGGARAGGGHAGGGHGGGFGGRVGGQHGGFGGGHAGGGHQGTNYLWNNGTITCTFTNAAPTFGMALTIRRNIQMWGNNWGHKNQNTPKLTASLQLNPTGAFVTAAYDIVFTQMGRTTPGCTSDGMGPVIRPVSKHYGGWGNAWGGGWGTNGVLSTVTLVSGTAQTISLDGLLPMQKLAQFAGRGLLLCLDGALTTDATGQTICPDASILGCCTLGYDNQGAALP